MATDNAILSGETNVLAPAGADYHKTGRTSHKRYCSSTHPMCCWGRCLEGWSLPTSAGRSGTIDPDEMVGKVRGVVDGEVLAEGKMG